ncbi:MAG: DUF1491 family protein [Alphaproteobacteria bacterium]|nr:DUF1491 family protein [Alphaproteobacteria bacterium]
MPQLRSDLWCAAFVRRHNDIGDRAVVVRKGDPVAGQVWIELDHLDGTVTLFAPAPAPYYEEKSHDRLFERRLTRAAPEAARDRMEREARFDSDFWLLGLETRSDNPGIDVVSDGKARGGTE